VKLKGHALTTTQKQEALIAIAGMKLRDKVSAIPVV